MDDWIVVSQTLTRQWWGGDSWVDSETKAKRFTKEEAHECADMLDRMQIKARKDWRMVSARRPWAEHQG